MLRVTTPLALLLLCSVAYAADLPEHPPAGWQLAFSDEFHSFDKARWSTTFSDGQRHLGHNEKEMYVDPSYAGNGSTPLGLNPFSIGEDGLTIRADRPGPLIRAHLQGQRYTSGVITTFRSFRQTYGYFEIRAQMPSGRGLWPSFWLLPVPIGLWPPEIDIVEVLGHEPTKIYTTIHWQGANGKPRATSFDIKVPDTSKDFHTYGVLWTPENIGWYFDGQRVATTATPTDMHQPMWLLINLAVGGDWPGMPDTTTKFPADLHISYIKAYALPPDWQR
jgi:beta-glucanase (GH16 family)